MKGVAFAGPLYLPHHPAADIHGLVRAVIRTRSWLWAEESLQKAGIARTHALWITGLWSPSKSAVEIHLSAQHYNELLICPLAEAYLAPASYQVYKTQPETPAPDIPASATTPK